MESSQLENLTGWTSHRVSLDPTWINPPGHPWIWISLIWLKSQSYNIIAFVWILIEYFSVCDNLVFFLREELVPPLQSIPIPWRISSGDGLTIKTLFKWSFDQYQFAWYWQKWHERMLTTISLSFLENVIGWTSTRNIDYRILGALRAPTSSLWPFGPALDPSGPAWLRPSGAQAVWPTQRCNDWIVC